MRQSTFVDWAHRILESARLAFVFFASTIIALWTIAPLRRWLAPFGVFDTDSVLGVVSITLLLVLTTQFALSHRLHRLAQELDLKGGGQGTQLLRSGSTKTNAFIADVVENIKKGRQRTVEVLGVHLGSSWPLLRGWLNGHDAENWSLAFYCLAPDYVREQCFLLSSTWVEKAEANTKEIIDFLQNHVEELQERRIEVHVYHYRSFPAIHGLQLGNGDVFLTSTQWNRDGKVEATQSFYEYVPAADGSARAKLQRDLFTNWFGRAKSTSTHVFSSVTT